MVKNLSDAAVVIKEQAEEIHRLRLLVEQNLNVLQQLKAEIQLDLENTKRSLLNSDVSEAIVSVTAAYAKLSAV